MEQVLSGRDDSAVIRGLQALLPLVLRHWGQAEPFREAATPLLAKELGLEAAPGQQAALLADQTFRQVMRLRGSQFRPFQDAEALDQAYTRLVPTATDSPVRQGFLWLAFQAQRSANVYLNGEDGKNALARLKLAVNEQKALFASLSPDSPQLTLATVEKFLTALAQKAVPEVGGEIRYAALTGHLLEWARAEAREGSDVDLLASNTATITDDARLLTPLVEPVRQAELKEAHLRFLRMSDQAKTRRFDGLRKVLVRQISEVAPAAPKGFEGFCAAVEALLFPYPTQLEWIRSYLKPIFTNAQQSSIFDNCLTEPAIAQRFEKLREEKSANITMLELSRALAMSKVSKGTDTGQQEFLEKLDLRAEFHWPGSLEEWKRGGAG